MYKSEFLDPYSGLKTVQTSVGTDDEDKPYEVYYVGEFKIMVSTFDDNVKTIHLNHSEAQVLADFLIKHLAMHKSKMNTLESEGWTARKTCSDWNAPGQFRCDCSEVCKEWLKAQEGEK